MSRHQTLLTSLRYLINKVEKLFTSKFGEALRGVQDKLAEKKFYMNCDNMQTSDCGCNNNDN